MVASSGLAGWPELASRTAVCMTGSPKKGKSTIDVIQELEVASTVYIAVCI